MAKLLVSVRSAAEARAALAGGADLIDVKEPRLGSLGPASRATIRHVCDAIGENKPVSAAFGELIHARPRQDLPPLAYAKWGLSGYGGRDDWTSRLLKARNYFRRHDSRCALVAVSYADWKRANAPQPKDVRAFARQEQCGALLIDTWRKDGTTLLDWLTLNELADLCHSCNEAGVPVALAGSLSENHIARLLFLQPAWFAVRGAVCRSGKRTGSVDIRKVRALAELVKLPATAAMCAS